MAVMVASPSTDGGPIFNPCCTNSTQRRANSTGWNCNEHTAADCKLVISATTPTTASLSGAGDS
eukprot:9280838-Prorocentrum_lima.AAC.1